MILGLDFSTKALHAALIPLEHDNGEPAIAFRHEPIKASVESLDRYFQTKLAMRQLCKPVDEYPVHIVAIEQPMGKFAVRQMWGMFGAICASLPGQVEHVQALQPMEWRRELGLPPRMTKEAAVDEALEWCIQNGAAPSVLPLNEHMAEALLIALAGRQQNHRAWSEGAA